MSNVPEQTRKRGRPPKSADGDDRRDQILRAALKVFSLAGFDGSTTAEIAEEAGVTQPLLNYYFKSKDELWREAASTAYANLERIFTQATKELSDLDPLSRLRVMIRKFVYFSAQYPEIPRLVMLEGMRESERLDWLVEHSMRPLHEVMDSLLLDAEATGQIRVLRKPNMAFIMIGAASFFFTAAPIVSRLYGIELLSPEEIDAHVETVTEILLQGIVLTENVRSDS